MTATLHPGLECLVSSSKLLITQNIKLLGTALGLPDGGYVVFNDLKEPLFWVVEDYDCISHVCLPSKRPLSLRVYSVTKSREVLFLIKPLRCPCCCSVLCLPRVDVYSTTGAHLGFIQQKCKFFYPEFEVKDAENNLVLIIRGPFFNYFVSNLYVLSKDRKYTLGEIKKNWRGFLKELLTTSDFFGVAYPQDLAVGVKALLLGAALLIVSSVLFLKLFFCFRYNSHEPDGLNLLTSMAFS